MYWEKEIHFTNSFYFNIITTDGFGLSKKRRFNIINATTWNIAMIHAILNCLAHTHSWELWELTVKLHVFCFCGLKMTENNEAKKVNLTSIIPRFVLANLNLFWL